MLATPRDACLHDVAETRKTARSPQVNDTDHPTSKGAVMNKNRTSKATGPQAAGRFRRIRKLLAAGVAVAAGTSGLGVLGAPPPAGAIIGGTATSGTAHPYYVRVMSNGALCGG